MKKNIVSVALILGGVILALNEIPHWGWLVFFGILLEIDRNYK